MVDNEGMWGTNPVTVARNGNLIDNTTENYVADVRYGSVTFMYVTAQTSWELQQMAPGSQGPQGVAGTQGSQGYQGASGAGGAAVTYDFTVKVASFTATSGYGYFIDTDTSVSALDVDVTLPASPNPGDMIEIWHVGPGDVETPATNEALTVLRNGKLIMGIADNLSVNKNQTAIRLMFLNNTYGWRIGVL
jgi:hypothetical protein